MYTCTLYMYTCTLYMYTYMWPVTWKGYYTVLKCKFCIVWTKLTSRSATSKGCPPSKHWTLTRLRLGQFRQLFVFWLPPFHEHLSIATSALQDSGVRGGGNGRTLLQCSHLYGFSDTEWAEQNQLGSYSQEWVDQKNVVSIYDCAFL